MSFQAIEGNYKIDVTRIMPSIKKPAPKSIKRSLSLEASSLFVLGATMVVWATTQNVLETFAAYYLIGMSTLYVVTRKKPEN